MHKPLSNVKTDRHSCKTQLSAPSNAAIGAAPTALARRRRLTPSGLNGGSEPIEAQALAVPLSVFLWAGHNERNASLVRLLQYSKYKGKQ